jgi:hypothetical protein
MNVEAQARLSEIRSKLGLSSPTQDTPAVSTGTPETTPAAATPQQEGTPSSS